MDSLEGLRSLEEIRQVKYRSLRCVDLKLWDEIGDVFTEDADLDYGTVAYGKPLQIAGRPGIVAFFRTKLGPDTLTSHSAGQPEITVDGDSVSTHRATGIWQVTRPRPARTTAWRRSQRAEPDCARARRGVTAGAGFAVRVTISLFRPVT